MATRQQLQPLLRDHVEAHTAVVDLLLHCCFLKNYFSAPVKQMDRKIQYALITALAYVVLSYPQTYKITNSLTSTFNVSTSNPAGCPNLTGLILHGSVAGGIVYALLAQNYLVAMTRPPVMSM